MTVAVVGSVAARAALERALEGWEDAMSRPDSVAWLVDRLRRHGILGPDDPTSPVTT